MNDIFMVPGEMSKITTMSKNTLRLQLDTQENVSPEAMKRIFEWHNKLGWFLFAVRQIEAQDLLDLPELKPTDESKTPSQRLRAVLYRLYEQNQEQFKEFESYYRFKMEKIIDHLKGHLD
jgi:hypothetical protein